MERVWARLRAVFSRPSALICLLLLSLMLLWRSGLRYESAQTRLEKRLQHTLSQIEGAGKVQVVIRTKKVSGKDSGSGLFSGEREEEIPCGAIAIAQGADDPMVSMRITRALCALLSLHASQVDVLAALEGGE